MNQNQLEILQSWFDTFVVTYNDIPNPDFQNIALKIEHTRKVCDIMELLTAGEGMDPDNCRTAAAVALLHDVGRFPQYRRWRTFRDSESDNHARLGIDTIRKESILKSLRPEETLLIEEAIRFHNLLTLPKKYRSNTDIFIRLIRDADKLDIWRVFVEHFQKPVEERASAVTLGFPDTPEVSSRCVEQIMEGRVVELKNVQSVNDFRLLLLSWVFDLTIPSSFGLLQGRGYLEKIASFLPQNRQITAAMEVVKNRFSNTEILGGV